MADLSEFVAGERRSRGQIILVTGFALAVSFVALALVLNSVIYTENLATRSEAAKASDAVKVKSDMVDATAAIISHVNEYNASGGTNYETLVERVRIGLTNTTQYARGYQVTNGQAVDATLVATDEGTWINQSFASRNFTDKTYDPDWTLVDDADGARNLRLHVTDPDAIENTGNISASPSVDDLDDLHNFTIVAEDTSGATWTMEIVHEDNNELSLSESGYVVSVVDGDGDRRTCDVLDDTGGVDSFWVNVSAGTFNGTECRALRFGEDIGPTSDLRFRNSNNVNGTYRVLVNESESAVRDGSTYNAPGSSGPPPITDTAIYGAKIFVEYEEQRMVYETDARVVPGETDD